MNWIERAWLVALAVFVVFVLLQMAACTPGLKAEQTNKQESDQSCELTCFFSRIKPEDDYGFPAWQE